MWFTHVVCCRGGQVKHESISMYGTFFFTYFSDTGMAAAIPYVRDDTYSKQYGCRLQMYVRTQYRILNVNVNVGCGMQVFTYTYFTIAAAAIK